ncbi:MAG: hypothetical protein B6244_05510 [Candidatus Cloacimonetes bacterium 4572_55]|nr:MAG: hypothetical protein B6244_05510 [Candidatus Cloacimonetes bacterium 4572_55]
MKWSDIRKKYPGKFILIGDFTEEIVSENQSKITEGRVIKVSTSGKEIMQAYRFCKQKGQNVLYSLPTTPEEFVVKNVPFRGILS